MARPLSVVIVGAGFGGVAAAIKLKQQGIEDIVLLERGERIGGVWRANTYPGAACDVPSHLYSFSFAPNPHWSRRFSPGAEIQRYLEDVSERFGVTPHIRFGQDVERASWDDEAGRWRLSVAGADDVEADVLITACGQLTRASIPDLPGLNRFKGALFHSAHWDHGFDHRQKRVAVLGSGASAIQFAPAIAPEVAQLTVFQRSAPWVLGKLDRLYPERVRRLHARFPLLPRIWRRGWWLWFESLVPLFTRPKGPAARVMRPLYIGVSQLNRFAQLRGDRALWRATKPDYAMGCKRILITADWFPTLRRPNVELVTDRVSEVTEDAVLTEAGTRHPVDAIIFGTGFTATEFLAPMEVEGRGGRSLAHDAWARGGEAYLGISVPDFPNMFLLYGPNTNHGTGSAVELLEMQANYAAEAARLLAAGEAERLEVRREVHDAFQAELAVRLADSVWMGCSSWYVNAEGRITNNWPGSQTEYRRRTRSVALADYVTTAQPSSEAAAEPAAS